MNRRSYNAIAMKWDAARSSLHRHEPAFLEHLLLNLQAPARILDLGCGTGRPIAEFLLKKGFLVTGVDQAENLLALARQRFPESRWRQAEMEAFEADETYDTAIIWDSIFHVPKEHHESILAKVLHSLRPAGRLMLSVGGSDHPAFTDTMYEHTFFYDSLTPEKTISVLQELGAIIEHASFINLPTTGRDKGRFGIVASTS